MDVWLNSISLQLLHQRFWKAYICEIIRCNQHFFFFFLAQLFKEYIWYLFIKFKMWNDYSLTLLLRNIIFWARIFLKCLHIKLNTFCFRALGNGFSAVKIRQGQWHVPFISVPYIYPFPRETFSDTSDQYTFKKQIFLQLTFILPWIP